MTYYLNISSLLTSILTAFYYLLQSLYRLTNFSFDSNYSQKLHTMPSHSLFSWPTGMVSKGLVSIHLVPARQRTRLHRIGKADTDKCKCGEVITGTHVVEECPELGHAGRNRESGERP